MEVKEKRYQKQQHSALSKAGGSEVARLAVSAREPQIPPLRFAPVGMTKWGW